MLAVITVTSPADNLFVDGEVTLREAIQAANTDAKVDGSEAGSGADGIKFSAALSGQTIKLGGTELRITEALTIDATALAKNVTIDAQQNSRIFNITATTGDFTLAGLTLTRGRMPFSNEAPWDTSANGGAIRSVSTGNLTLDQSTVSRNSTTGILARGGGIFSAGAVTLTNSTVSGNGTGGYGARGGGILSIGDVTLTNSTVSGNSTAGIQGYGGGIFSAGTVTLTSSTVSGNSTAGNSAKGGGIRAYVAVTLTNSTVSGNFTEANGAVGGGIWAFGDVTLTSSTVSGNSTMGSHAYGGGIFSERTVTLTSSTVSGNSTAGGHAYGGGILALRDVTLTSSTVSGNSTTGYNSHGGGIRSFGDVTLTNSTLTDNHANDSNATGGGIWNNNDPISITNSIVADNQTGGGSPDIRPGTGVFDANFSLLGKAVVPDPGGSGNLFNNSPLLGVLANNGGPTETHSLLSGSLAIDAGDPSILFNANEYDQRGPGAPGFVRVFGGRIDIGAFETGTTVSPLEGDYDNDGFVGQADLDLVLLNWGKTSPPVPAGWVNQVPIGLIGQAALDGPLLNWGDGTSPIETLKSGQSAGGSRQEVPADLIDAVMAIEQDRKGQVSEAPTLEKDPAFAETVADHVFAANILAPAVVFADEDEPHDTNSSEDVESKTQWLTDELLERVFG